MLVYVLITTLLVAASVSGGYFLGKRKGRKEVDDQFFNLACTWKATSERQARTIEDIHDKLIYFTVGEIGDLYEYLKDEEDAEDTSPLLGIVMNECKFVEWRADKIFRR